VQTVVEFPAANVPLLHGMQAMAPTVLENLPTGQTVHVLETMSLEYVPTAQAVHSAAEVSLTRPGVQPPVMEDSSTHWVELLAPPDEVSVEGQAVQEAAPLTWEYEPGAQLVQRGGETSGVPKKVPGRHSTQVLEADCLPAAQLVHTVAPVAATIVPGPHFIHMRAPSTAE
jgi:hypothetical protein